MVEAQNVELGARGRVEDVREGDLHRLRERGHARGLDRDVEGVLQHARRQHVLDQCRRHRGDADLHVAEDLAVRAHGGTGRHGERELLALRVGEAGRSRRRVGGDHRVLGVAHVLQHVACDARQVDLHPVGIGHALGGGAHAAHHGVGDAGQQLGAHHHLREEHAGGRVGGGTAIDRDLDRACGQVVEREVAGRVGVDELVLVAQHVDLGVRDRQQEHIVWRVAHAVGSAPDVVESARLQVGTRIDNAPHQLGAGGGELAHRGEGHGRRTACNAVAVAIEKSAVGGGTDQRAINMHRNVGRARHRVGEEQPGIGAVGRRHDGRRQVRAVRPGGVVAVGRQRSLVDGAGEVDERAHGDADVAAARLRRQRGDGKRRQRVDLDMAGNCCDIAGRIARNGRQHMVAHVQRGERQRVVERARRGIEVDVAHHAAVKLIGELHQVRAGAERHALEALRGAERVALGHAGQRQRRPDRIEQEAAFERLAGVASNVDRGDRIEMLAVGRAIQGQAGGEAEAAVRIQRERLRAAEIDADRRAGDARQVVQHLAGKGQIAAGGRRHAAEQHLGRLLVLRQRKARQHGLRHLGADGLALVVVEDGVDAAVDAAQAGLVGGLAEAGEAARDARQRGTGGAESGTVAKGGGQHPGRCGTEGAVA